MKYPSQELPFKDIIENNAWQNDDVFAMQRLAGLNTMSLRKMTIEGRKKAQDSYASISVYPPVSLLNCTESDSMTVIPNMCLDYKKDHMNKTYDWDAAMRRASGKESTFEEVNFISIPENI